MSSHLRRMLLAKIHGASVTEANVAYEGSITIPKDLLDHTGLLPHEAVWVWNITSGSRFETYILAGEAGSRQFCVNGAAAHRAAPGDRLIIAGFMMMPLDEALQHSPTVIFMNNDNSIADMRSEKPKRSVNL